ncbi:LysM domain-containing protein [Wenzhouxiangella sp. XN201]|uniref:LysM peptidoglycan-binding domain-containing protein n=1 Tax=Wenzhouxiangella sp. XN201 TaxID=2710755 RepID=UPI0013DBB004|nr:LysM domain-containing protein [Wenzhouxiangella sp. XN201]
MLRSRRSRLPDIMTRRYRNYPAIRPYAVILVLLLAGCQFMPQREDEQALPDQSGVVEPVAPSIGEAIAHLQEGRIDQAEAALDALLAQQPEHGTARLLMRQIRDVPEALLGEDFVEIEVESGDSLSVLADRYAGNPLLFHSLARLNDIERPRLLRPGQRLKVPAPEALEPAEDPVESAAPDPAETVTSAGPVERVAELRAEGRQDRAYDLLLSAARSGGLDRNGQTSLAELAIERSVAARRNDDPERAIQILDQVEPWLNEQARPDAFARERSRVETRLAVLEAHTLVTRNDYDAAFDLLGSHGVLGEDATSDSDLELEWPDGLMQALSDHYHAGALTAWRDQEVSEAIRLWQRVLEIDPDFEPAAVYLERARRVQRRLEAMEPD